MMRSAIGLLLLAVALTGCGGGGSSGPSIDITGTYRVNGATTDGRSFTATATLQQSGSAVTGSYQNSAGGTFRVDGTVSGTHVQGRSIGTNNPAVCDLEGDFLPDGREGTGNYTCRAGGSVVESGSFTTSRIG